MVYGGNTKHTMSIHTPVCVPDFSLSQYIYKNGHKATIICFLSHLHAMMKYLCITLIGSNKTNNS